VKGRSCNRFAGIFDRQYIGLRFNFLEVHHLHPELIRFIDHLHRIGLRYFLTFTPALYIRITKYQFIVLIDVDFFDTTSSIVDIDGQGYRAGLGKEFTLVVSEQIGRPQGDGDIKESYRRTVQLAEIENAFSRFALFFPVPYS
jgi:hypothetical protein